MADCWPKRQTVIAPDETVEYPRHGAPFASRAETWSRTLFDAVRRRAQSTFASTRQQFPRTDTIANGNRYL